LNGGKTRVLVVENNKDLCEVIEALLKEEDDMELAGIAYDGVQALEMIPKTQPDVILLDIIMPYLDGMEVLNRLNEAAANERPRVIVLSAFEEEEMVRRCARLGADYYLLKPFDSDNLINRIRQVVSSEPFATKPRGERAYAPRDRGRDADRKPRGAQFDLETESTRILYNLGVPTYFKGYSYIKEAIMLVTRDIRQCVCHQKICFFVVGAYQFPCQSHCGFGRLGKGCFKSAHIHRSQHEADVASTANFLHRQIQALPRHQVLKRGQDGGFR
jgi:two-component system response regulator (stage 0 sporulation protein A)